MIENLIIISIIGFVVGFIISIPAAGPTSIVIFTNALKGRIRYCNFLNLGGSIADFTYVFISVYGLTQIYSLYKPYIPYVFIAGSLFVIFISFKVAKTDRILTDIDESNLLPERKEENKQNGFLTGIMLGFLNPGLFMSSMASSLIVLTTLNSYGFDTGGLDIKVSDQRTEIQSNGTVLRDTSTIIISQLYKSKLLHQTTAKENSNTFPKSYPFLLSLCYALFISFGSIIWFYYMTLFIAKFRKRINTKIIHRTIKVLGLILFLFGLLLAYNGITIIWSTL